MITLEGHTACVNSVAFSGAGMLASGSFDKTIKLWNISTKQCEKTLEGHTKNVWCVAFNHDSKLLASVSEDRTIKLWDISTMNCIKTLTRHGGPIWSVAFNGVGNMLACGNNKTINLSHIYTKKFIKTALMTMNRCGLIDDIIDNIMEKLGIIDKKGNITGCTI